MLTHNFSVPRTIVKNMVYVAENGEDFSLRSPIVDLFFLPSNLNYLNSSNLIVNGIDTIGIGRA